MDNAGEQRSVSLIVPHLTPARALPGAKKLSSDLSGINPTYVGLLDTGSQAVEAYIKVLTPRQLINEIITAVLGHTLSLPMPKGFIVLAGPNDGYGDPAPFLADGPERLLFASEAAPGGVWRPVKRVSPYPLKYFLEWVGLPVTVCFDEWIANVDRNTGNFLFDGAGKFLLIDHSHVFGGEAWVEIDLRSDRVWLNKLIDEWPGKMIGADARAHICSAVSQHAKAFAGVDLSFFALEPLQTLLSASEVEALRAFLQERCARLATSLPHRLGIPRLVP